MGSCSIFFLLVVAQPPLATLATGESAAIPLALPLVPCPAATDERSRLGLDPRSPPDPLAPSSTPIAFCVASDVPSPSHCEALHASPPPAVFYPVLERSVARPPVAPQPLGAAVPVLLRRPAAPSQPAVMSVASRSFFAQADPRLPASNLDPAVASRPPPAAVRFADPCRPASVSPPRSLRSVPPPWLHVPG